MANAKPLAPVKPTAEDEKQAELTRAVCAAIVDAMRPMIADNRDKLVRTFQAPEIEAIAVAAVSAYITKRAALEKAAWNPPLPDFLR